MSERRRVVISTRIAGPKHHRGANDRLCALQCITKPERLALTLVCEPTNAHDPNAVKVYHRGLMLGYVPKDISERVSRYVLDRDIEVRATKTPGTFNEMTIEAVAGDPLA